jgi:hypothetical protein
VSARVMELSNRNPKIDADLLFYLKALITAHAGLVMLYPDVANLRMNSINIGGSPNQSTRCVIVFWTLPLSISLHLKIYSRRIPSMLRPS